MSNWELLIRVIWKIVPVFAIVLIPSLVVFALDYRKEKKQIGGEK